MPDQVDEQIKAKEAQLLELNRKSMQYMKKSLLGKEEVLIEEMTERDGKNVRQVTRRNI